MQGQSLLTKDFIPNFQIFIFKDLAFVKSNMQYLVICEVTSTANRIEKLAVGHQWDDDVVIRKTRGNVTGN